MKPGAKNMSIGLASTCSPRCSQAPLQTSRSRLCGWGLSAVNLRAKRFRRFLVVVYAQMAVRSCHPGQWLCQRLMTIVRLY